MYLEIIKHLFITKNGKKNLKKINLGQLLGFVSGAHVKDSP